MPSIVADDFSWAIELPMPDGLLEALERQIQRMETGAAKESFQRRLAEYVSPALVESLDGDLKPPTDSQTRFAEEIADRLGIGVPISARASRAGMQAFIRTNIGKLKKN